MTSSQLTAATLLVAGASALAQAQAPLPALTKDTSSLAATQLIQHFARASDRRDTAALEALLHPAFRVVFNLKPGTAPTVLDREQYLQMARDGKIGGLDRNVTVTHISLANGFAIGTSRMEHEKATFQSAFSLIQSDGQWLLLQEAVLMSPSSAAK
jgi:Putative lumazine-binding